MVWSEQELSKSAKYKVVNLIPREELGTEREILEKIGCEVIQGSGKTSEDIIRTARDADAIIGSGQPMTREVFESLKKLRMIALIGVGFDTVDVKAATENGVLITHVPDILTDPVADHTLALILSLIRRIPQADNMVKKGIWESVMPKWAGYVPRLRGLTAGIVGFGRTGRAVATRLIAFGLNVIAYDPYIKPEARQGAKFVETLEELLKQSDIVSLHVFLSQDTKHLFNEETFRKMKKTAFLVNTSRGAVIDERKLYEALTKGWIAGAALDVMEEEPPKRDNPLLKLENVIITPHISYYTLESLLDQRKRTAEEVARALQGLSPLHPVNPEVLQSADKKR
jgi:D-3-phosphoglycerate dehydrogenase